MGIETGKTEDELNAGIAIRQLREEKGLTVKELSYMVFLTEQELIDIEAGNQIPDKDTNLMISNLFSVSPSELGKGYIVEQMSREETIKLIHEIRAELTQLKEDTMYFRRFIQKWELGDFSEEKTQSHYEAIEVEGQEERKADDRSGEYEYIIKDVVNERVVCNANGEQLVFQSQTEAEQFARDLNYQMDTGLLKEEKEAQASVEMPELAK